ncbi:MAG TPA: lysylphosphatidylglycerol synthase domain-containing protein [Nannocystaceae bacterium]|nr:lysylphosphatidylglycerol synthase domain-containing protein [Nannocystaceae bacterium]
MAERDRASGAAGGSRSPARLVLLWAASLVIGGLLLWLARAHFGVALWPDDFSVARPAVLSIAIALVVPYAWIRASRLRWVLDPLVVEATGEPSRFDRAHLLGSGWVSYLVLMVLPFKVGEVSRPLLLAAARQPGVGVPEAVGAVGIERIVDGLLVCAMLFGGIAASDAVRFPLGDELAGVQSFGQWMLAAFAAALAVALWISRAPDRWAARAQIGLAFAGPRIADRISGAVARLGHAFAQLAALRRVAPLAIASIVYWTLTVLQLALVALACGLELGAAEAAAVVAIVGLSIQLPGGPAQTGTFQVGAGAAVSLFVDPATHGNELASFVALMFAVQLGGAVAMALPGAALLAAGRRRGAGRVAALETRK